MKITAVDSVLVEIPQKYPIAPYQSRYRAASSKQALLFCVETDEGITGWGEAPQRYLGEPISPRVAESLRGQLVGKELSVAALYNDWSLDGQYVQSGIEMAVWDILGKACGQPLYVLLGGLYRPRVELAACMGIRPPEEASAIAQLYVEMGFSTLKTKAGRDAAEDLAMVRAIREAVGDQLKLRIDPNTGYSPEAALQLARDLEPYNLEYFEQPMPADLIDISAKMRGQTKTPLALNESVTTFNQVREILDKQAAAVILPDTYQCGGIWAVKVIGEMAGAAGVPCVFHCAHDLGPKTAAMLHVVASTASFSLANDCTYYGLEDDVLANPFQIENGYLTPPASAGLGVEVDIRKVQKYAVEGTLK